MPSYRDETIRKPGSHLHHFPALLSKMNYPRSIEVSHFPGLTASLREKTKGAGIGNVEADKIFR